ncbi:MAG: adenylosuccinate synthase [Pseudomonadota bacterium]
MLNITVIGAQWGDEGKGKIVDWLSEKADIVVRFQGGHNAGHTLVIDHQVYKLSMLPSGIVRKGVLSIIGNGTVIDVDALCREIQQMRALHITISPQSLIIAENATLILPIHQKIDQLRENTQASEQIGTTKRGIGPAYEDKAARRAIRVCDLEDTEYLKMQVEHIYQYHNIFLKAAGQPVCDFNEAVTMLCKLRDQIMPFVAPVWRILTKAKEKKQRILFEGAQGAMLDIDHGTYPYVTSSNTVAGQVGCGSGLGPDSNGLILGIVKAYTTRVGSGPFPSEQHNEIGDLLSKHGAEIGTVTGRKRRCGWLDSAMLRQTVQINSIQAIALTKLDVLDHFKTLHICTGYNIEGKFYDYLPASPRLQERAIAHYETHPGWACDTRGTKNLSELPKNAISYIKKIEKLVNVPIKFISTSPKREDTIIVEDIFR